MRCFIILANVAALFFASFAEGAITYNFSSPGYEIGKQSNGLILDSTFRFQLGGFTAGFIPTASNEGNWLANFQSVGSGTTWTIDDVGVGHFNGIAALTANTATLSNGAQAYIWGFNNTALSGSTQWVLFKNSAWTFGDATTSPPLIQYDTSDLGTTATVGVLNNPDGQGNNPYIQTSPAPEPSTFILLGFGVVGMSFLRQRKVC